MSNETVLRKILNFVKVNSIWTIIGAVAALIGVPTTIWTIKEHNKKPDIGISIAGFTIPEDNPCNIYYLIPEEYYEGPMNGAILLDVFNSGSSELNNVKAMIDTKSVYETQPTVIFSSGKAKTVEQNKLRFRRFVQQEFQDDIAGERIGVTYSGFSERISFVCENLPKGMLKRIQPQFVIDRDYLNKLSAVADESKLGKMKGGKVYDVFSIDISYAATGVQATKISNIPIIVTEEVDIKDIIEFYKNEGQIFGATMYNQNAIDNGYVNSIVIYPRYTVEDNVINVDIENAQYYYIKFDTFFKVKNKRRITILNLNIMDVESYEFKDTPEQKEHIKKYYDTTYQGLRSRK
jgi:hypothetical protein